MKTKTQKETAMLISAMAIFGTVGIFRRYIPLPSSLIALIRGLIGTAFLLLILLFQHKKPDKAALKRNLPILILSGAAIGFNWILLFEAYCYTSVATATLCYYLSPILVILAAPMVLKEKLTLRQMLCAGAALLGMIPVSGILQTGFSGLEEMKGILFGLAAALLYACVILINKRITGLRANDRTLFQLLFATVALLPYVAFSVDTTQLKITLPGILLLGILGIVHTGLAYWMYFASIDKLQAHSVAIWSYLDPVVAILLSNLILQEPMTPAAWIGAIMILGAAYLSEK